MSDIEVENIQLYVQNFKRCKIKDPRTSDGSYFYTTEIEYNNSNMYKDEYEWILKQVYTLVGAKWWDQEQPKLSIKVA